MSTAELASCPWCPTAAHNPHSIPGQSGVCALGQVSMMQARTDKLPRPASTLPPWPSPEEKQKAAWWVVLGTGIHQPRDPGLRG